MTAIDETDATSVSVAGDWLAAGAGGVWLSAPGDRVLRRLDPSSGAVVATIQVPQDPCEASDVGFGSVWTATCGTPGLARVDPATNSVSGFVPLAIPSAIDGEGSVGAGEGGVWLVIDGNDCSACVAAKVDPRSLEVVARVPVRDGAASVRVGYGAVWVTNPRRELVQKIDPATNRVVATTPVPGGPRFFDVGEGAVWTLDQVSGTVTRIDPETAEVEARIEAGLTGSGGDLTVGAGWVWPRAGAVLLTRIDPRTNAIAERYEPPAGSGAAIVDGDAVWLSAHDVRTVWRLPAPKP